MVRDRYYDRKKKVLVVCLAGARSLLQPENKSSSPLSGGCAIIITTGKQKDTVVCLAGAGSLLRLEKKSSSRLSGGFAINIKTGKKSSSRLSGGCAIVITTGKSKFLVQLKLKLIQIRQFNFH